MHAGHGCSGRSRDVPLDGHDELGQGPDQRAGVALLVDLIDELDEPPLPQVVEPDVDDGVDPLVQVAAPSRHLQQDEAEHFTVLDPLGHELVTHHAAEDVVVQDDPVVGLLAERQVAGRHLLALGLAERGRQAVGGEPVVLRGVRELRALQGVGAASQHRLGVTGDD